jgi:hypothetical protein
MGKIILLQIFWLSFGLIGLTALSLGTKKSPKLKRSQFVQFLKQAASLFLSP